jgi:hypothetical protein
MSGIGDHNLDPRDIATDKCELCGDDETTYSGKAHLCERCYLQEVETDWLTEGELKHLVLALRRELKKAAA